MTEKKVSELTALVSPDDADLMMVVDTSATESKKITWANAKADVNNISDADATALTGGGDTTLHDHDGISENTAARHTQGTDVALGGVSAKNPPIDADKVLYRDSTDSDAIVTSTFTQVKAFLKTYFDTLYNKYVHPNHSGEVTSVGDGSQTIAIDAVTYAKMQNVVDDERILGRVSGANGVVEELTKNEVLTMINVANGADVTGSNSPQAHTASHTDGSDDIQNATAAQKGVATAAQITKLDTIEASADVTDATNVANAGAIMNTLIAAKGDIIAASADDTPVIVSVGANTTVLTANSAVAGGVSWAVAGAPGAHKDTHDPNDGSDSLDTAAAAEVSAVVAAGSGVSHSLARADHIHAINHAISDNHLVTVDGTTNQPVSTDYAKFTANGLEGKDKAGMLSDIGMLSGTGTFAGASGVTVTIGSTLAGTSYRVVVTATADSEDVGAVYVLSKTTTTFKVHCTGTGTPSFDWILIDNS